MAGLSTIAATGSGTAHGAYPEALWLRTASAITADISAGEYLGDRRLPSERALGIRLGVSRATLRKALQHLVADGVLVAHQGRGWFVASQNTQQDWPNSLESFTETAARMGLEASSIVVTSATMPVGLDDAELLGVAPGSPVVQIDRVRLLGAVRIAVDRAIIPAALAPTVGESDFSTASLYRALESNGAQLHHADSTVEARSADADSSAALGIAVGAPVLSMSQLVCDERGRPILLSRITYAGERYRLRTSFSRGRPGADT